MPLQIRLSHLAAAGILAAAAAVANTGFGQPSTACAEPQEWDIQSYDDCVWKHLGDITNDVDAATVKYDCCLKSGGVWQAAEGKCVAPAANPAQQAPGNVVTQTFQPVPPPARQPGPLNPTMTFTPAG